MTSTRARRPVQSLRFLVLTASFSVFALGPTSSGCDDEASPPDVASLLELAGVLPGEGPVEGGIELVVVGQSIRQGASVTIQGNPAQVLSEIPGTALVIRLPAGRAGAADVVLTNPDGATSTIEAGFTYVSTTPTELDVTRSIPSDGSTEGEEPIALFGEGFNETTAVLFGSLPALEVELISATLLVVTTPPAPYGPVVVSVANADGSQAVLAEPFAFVDPPLGQGSELLTISEVIPNEGPSSGGTEVAVIGSAFTTGLSIAFAGVEVSEVDVLTSAVAVVETPSGEPGIVAVGVSQLGSEPATLARAFTYTDDTLRVDSIVPASGPTTGGSEVALLGSGFHDGLEVRFGATSAVVTVLSNEATRVISPTSEAGAVDVTASYADGTSVTVENGFTYVEASLTIDTVIPSHGPEEGGNAVAISGTGFDDTISVRFGENVAEIIELLSAQVVVVSAPAHASGAVDVTIENELGDVAVLEDSYGYSTAIVDYSVPSIDGALPNTGGSAGGTAIAISGNLLAEVTEVRISGALATEVTAIGDTVVTCTTPAGPFGPADIELPELELTLTNGFFYFDEASTLSRPEIDSIFPVVGSIEGGAPFRITGSRFDPAARVAIGNSVVEDVQWIDTRTITGRIPPATQTGSVDVTVYHPDGHAATLYRGFTYHSGEGDGPRLDDVSPPTVSVLGGTTLTASGDRFHRNVVFFVDLVPSHHVAWTNATRVDFTAPPHAPGSANVAAVNPDGLYSEIEAAISYIDQAPTISGVLPSAGPTSGQSAITISGTGFQGGAEVTVGGGDATDIFVLDPTRILAVTPPGEEGPADVTVTNPSGLSATADDAFAYFEGSFEDARPTLSSMFPAQGPVDGGTLAVLRGTNLNAGARVLIGSGEAEVMGVNGAWASLRTPPHSEGVVDVIWLSADGQVAILANGFRYSAEFLDPPIIGGVSPPSGPEEGGNPVIVAGSGFTSEVEVFFGHAPSLATVGLDSTFISAVAPPYEPGSVDVAVTNSDGVTTTLADGYRFVAAPHILGIVPAVGPLEGGTEIQISGQNFQFGAVVRLGSVSVLDVVVEPPSRITATTDAATAGLRDVVVTNPDGQYGVLSDGFEYLDFPELFVVTPGSGPSTGGTRAMLHGRRFRDGADVFVAGVAATDVVFVDGTLITVLIPAGDIGPADVQVINPDEQVALLDDGFVYVDPATLGDPPVVASCFPVVGMTTGHTPVRISGASFSGSPLSFFGGFPADTSFLSTDTLSAITPAGEEGFVRVEVTNVDGQTAGLDGCFQYDDDLGSQPAPLVYSIEPDEGPTAGAADVVITGDYFIDGGLVVIGNRFASSVVFESDARITARTPPGTAGLADVWVTNPDGKVGTLPDAYQYLPPPIVSSIDPSQGPSVGGTSVTVEGEGFEEGAYILIGGSLATEIAWLDSETMTAVTPEGTPGLADVMVINPDGQPGTLFLGFSFNPPPVVESVDPTSGSTLGEYWVSVLGSGFRAGATVDFGAVRSDEVQVLSGILLRANAPPSEAGLVDVTVTNNDGYSNALNDAFTFIAPPELDVVTPNTGLTDGGLTVSLIGSNFVVGAQVYFGGDLAGSISVDGPGVITCETPARPAGAAAVTVENPDGQEDTLPGAFLYLPPVPPPEVESISPNYGPVYGGTVANIVGGEFQDGAQAYFGDVPVPEGLLQVISTSLIRVRTPPSTDLLEAVVSLRVVNPDSQEHTLDEAFTYQAALALPPIALYSVTPNRIAPEGGVSATVLGNGIATDVQFSLYQSDTEVSPVTLLEYYGSSAVLVELPAVTETGDYDLYAYLPSTGDSAILSNGVHYRDFELFFTERRGRLPNEVRLYDRWPLLFDVDSDGYRDVFITRENRRNVLLLNRGESAPAYFDDFSSTNLIGEAATESSTNPVTVQYPLYADFTGDGLPDVLAVFNRTSYSGGHVIWVNEGFGTLNVDFTAGEGLFYKPAGSGEIVDWSVADLDNSNGLDVFVCTINQNHWLRNLGTDAEGHWLGFETLVFEATVNGVPGTVPSNNTRGCDAGDVNNDGYLDIVLANYGAEANRLYLSSGPPDWTYLDVSFPTEYPLFSFSKDSRSARFVDVEHDGDLDIVMANFRQDDYVLINDGTGHFTDEPTRICHNPTLPCRYQADGFLTETTHISVGSWSRGHVAGQDILDIDQDGCTDLMVSFESDGYVPRFYVQRPTAAPPEGCTGDFFYQEIENFDPDNPLLGLFRGTTGAEIHGLMRDSDEFMVEFADLDSDGWLDMFQTHGGLITNIPDQNRVYLRQLIHEDGMDDEGYFYRRFVDVTYEDVLPRDATACHRAEAVDINGDDSLDLVIANTAPNCNFDENLSPNQIYINDGEGNFYDESNRLPAQGQFTFDLALADFDDDGDDDLFTVSWWPSGGCGTWALGPTTQLFLNDGLGYFTDVSDLANLASEGPPTSGSYYPITVSVTDVDDDGDLDVVSTATHYSHNRLWINGGDPLNRGVPYFFDERTSLPSGYGADNSYAYALTLIDFDEDGDMDLYLGLNNQNRLWRNEGDHSGFFSDVTAIFLPARGSYEDTRAALAGNFYPGDALDLIEVNWNQRSRILLSQPDDSLSDYTDTNMPANDTASTYFGRTVDLDMDGLEDVVMASENTVNRFYLNLGDAAFTDRSEVIWPDAVERTHDVVLGDFDSDTDLDAFICNDRQQNRLYVNGLISD